MFEYKIGKPKWVIYKFRDKNLNWQVYFSRDSNQGIFDKVIVTYTITHLSGNGIVEIKTKTKDLPNVTLNHFQNNETQKNNIKNNSSNPYIEDLIDCFTN